MKKLNYFLLFAFLNIFLIEIGAMKRSLHESLSDLLHDELIEKKQKQEVLIKEKKIDQLIRGLPCVLNQIILDYLGSGPQKIGKEIIINDRRVTSVCEFKDNKILVGFDCPKIEIWDITSGHRIDTLVSDNDDYYRGYLCISDDKNKLIYQSADILRLWDLNSKVCIKIPITSHSFCVFLENNKIVLSSISDNTIKIYDLDKQNFIDTLIGHTDIVQCVCSIGNNKLISTSEDATMRIWDLNNKENCDLIKLNNSICCVCSLGDNKLALGSSKGVIEIWNLIIKNV